MCDTFWTCPDQFRTQYYCDMALAVLVLVCMWDGVMMSVLHVLATNCARGLDLPWSPGVMARNKFCEQ